MAIRFCKPNAANKIAFSNLNFRRLTSQNGNPSKCWLCGRKKMDRFEFSKTCSTCKVLQPSQQHNYFSLLRFPVQYSIDLDLLKNRYHKQQSILHPDKFTKKTGSLQKKSVDLSSLVNKAVGTLRDPLERAKYLLKLKGFDNDEKTHNTKMVVEMFALNEQIDKAEKSELVNLRLQNKKDVERRFSELGTFFYNEEWEKANDCLHKIMYLNRAIEIIDNKL
ncbi:hypothetical protein MHBO_002663 [Bonamia ostreae]|uniref:J domain-containing protein n=1 Tax=Bonamia ostreae TaxID=126728 RepID=A0ABV2ANU5_9EUKA